MPKVLRCWTEYFEALKSGAKTFEVRAMSPGEEPKVGETLFLVDFDPAKKEVGQVLGFVVTYALLIANSDAALILPFPKTGQPVWVFGGYVRTQPKLVNIHQGWFCLMGDDFSEEIFVQSDPNKIGQVKTAMEIAVKLAPDVDQSYWIDDKGEKNLIPDGTVGSILEYLKTSQEEWVGDDFEECLKSVIDGRQ